MQKIHARVMLQLWVSNSKLRREWELDESATMQSLTVTPQVSVSGSGFNADLRRCITLDRGLNTAVGVMFSQCFERSI